MFIILGASGFIGKYIYNNCKEKRIPTVGTYYCNEKKELYYFDIVYDNINELLGKNDYDEVTVIICNGITNIDECKKHPEYSNKVNVLSVKRILMQVKEIGAKPVFLSSEAVFDGKEGPYDENHIPNPITVYGTQKLEIEEFIKDNFSDFLIFRISRACSCEFGEKDIFGELYNKIVCNTPILCLKDQSFTLTDVEDIANIIIDTCQKGLSGVYHVSSDNFISRYELAKLYAGRFFKGYGAIYEKQYEELPFLDKRHVKAGLRDNILKSNGIAVYKPLNKMLLEYEISWMGKKV